MTILTISEAARFLRLSRRPMYTLKEIPRVRYAGKLVYVLEDLEAWVHSRREGRTAEDLRDALSQPTEECLPLRRCRSIFVLPKDSIAK